LLFGTGFFVVRAKEQGMQEQLKEMLQWKEERLLRLKQVLELVPVSKSSWWAGVKSGRYPASVKLGAKTTCWRLSEVMALIEQKEG
jgi:predicted DNA-binding transcriptional regulator AlpA